MSVSESAFSLIFPMNSWPAFHRSYLFNREMISKICSFLFIDFLLLRGYNYSQEMGFLLSNVFRLEKGARFFFYVHYII